MSEPAAQLKAVGEAREELHQTAKQALEWVRISEQRVARAESRLEQVRAEIKDRAMAALRRIGDEGRERIGAEREKKKAAEARAERAEQARDRAEAAFEQAREQAQADRGAFTAKLEASHDEALGRVELEADRRVAAAEQRAAEAEAAASEAHELAIRLEAEIEARVMQGTADVRREAEERVRALVEKVEGEATEQARARAEEALKAESERIRMQAEQREQRVKEAAEVEIKASAKRARREVLAVADRTAPSWARREAAGSGSGYRTF